MTVAPTSLAPALLAWQAKAGRHELPWQREPSAYRVWVSEIMLQQTQVATVIPYYLRFMQHFPDVTALAAAPLDEVLHLWSGLGYYARARNLHRAAQHVRDRWRGELPRSFEALAQLPGIGRSTAGAILALAHGERFPILDGNARRVLARYFGIEGGAADAGATRRLWQLAESCTPARAVQAYTQGIMDLGATVCVRRNPLCGDCPLACGCQARASGRQHEIPAPRRQAARRQQRVFMVVAVRPGGEVYLEQRPQQGIWGGLWCLPQFAEADAAAAFVRASLGAERGALQPLGPVAHGFTHFDLEIIPLLVRCAGAAGQVHEGSCLWYNIRSPARIGLPAPITTLLAGLADDDLAGSPARVLQA